MDKKTLRLKLFSLLCQFETHKTDKGEIVVDKTLEEGVEVYIGEEVAPDGEYTLEDKRVVTVKDGKVASIKEAVETEESVEEKLDETETVETVETEVEKEDTVDVEAILKENAELKAKVEELENKIKELNEKPVDEPLNPNSDGANEKFSDADIKRNPALRFFRD